jgi:sulfatase maturation enzyme AslB (radical SAM superfamily)
MLPICMGGCRLQALIKGNGFNGIDCHDEIQRFFLEEYIRDMASAVSLQEGQKDGALRIAA